MPQPLAAPRVGSTRSSVKALVRGLSACAMPHAGATPKDGDTSASSAASDKATANGNASSPASATKASNVAKQSLPHRYLSSVCQIHATLTPPEHSRPWVKERNTHTKGSGFIIRDRLIVTNAHCINYASVVKVQRHMSDEKINARVLRINSDCDVAVLTVDDPDFWLMPDPDSDDPTVKIELPALEFGQLPELQDTVRVVGYPVFGSEISITQGVVSRIQLQRYSYSDVNLLSVQTDSAVNPGNSGGPVLDSNNLVVGIAFQTLSNKDTDHVGEFIPCCVFERFLNSNACNGEVIQVPGISFYWQTLESKSMRAALGLDALDEPNDTGVYVNAVTSFGSVADVLREGDVIVSVEGVSVGNQGTIPFRSFRVGFSHLFTSRAVGDEINVGIVRDGKRMDVSWTLDSVESSRLVPVHDKMKAFRCDPEYLIIAGMVFIGLNAHSIQSEWNDDCSYESLALMKYYDFFGTKQRKDQECVLLSQVLDADVNSGYEGIQGEIVESFNGVPLVSVSHLAELYRACTDKYFRIKLVDKTYIILDREKATESEAEILLQHNIPGPSRIGLPTDKSKDVEALSSVSVDAACPDAPLGDMNAQEEHADDENVGSTTQE